MSEFPIIPLNDLSISMRKLVYGIGVNDADYVTNPTVDSKVLHCPIYVKWCSMLSRCYSDKYQSRWPTYVGCTVCDEWLKFTNFRKWVLDQSWEGKDLDKDILKPGNKVYGPEFCVFIDQSTNKLLNSHSCARGNYPQGVCLSKRNGKFIAQISLDSKRVRLGEFDSIDQAEYAYIHEKNKEIRRVAMVQSDIRIKVALLSMTETNKV